jgi:hypothetical protein
MIELDVELVRGILVVGLIISALTYHFFRVNSGGVVTAPFLAIMVLSADWTNLVGWLVLSTLGYLTIRYLSESWPLPRIWLFFAGIFVPMSIHILGLNLLQLPGFDTYSTYLAAGLYITNGLTAYDAARQGLIRTYISAAGVTLVTVIAGLFMYWLMQINSIQTEPLPAFVTQDPLLAFVIVSAAIVARLAFGLGTAGIIGGAYLLQIATPSSLLVVLIFTLVGAFIYKRVANFMGLSPKQAFYSLLVVGSLVAWFGLFWASVLGIPGTEQVESFALEPLLVVGLLIGETARFGAIRTVAGAALVGIAGWGITSLVSFGVISTLAAYFITVVLLTAGIMFAFKEVKRGWDAAVAGSSRWASH